MSRWRFLLLVLLICPACFAQDWPDFSGVYLRTGTFWNKGKQQQNDAPLFHSPLILSTRQEDGCLYVSAIQNGATAQANYWLRGPEAKAKGYKGCPWGERAKFKKGRMIVDSPPLWTPDQFSAIVAPHIKQSWELSSDRKSLIVKQLSAFGEFKRETFARMPSLEVANQKADSESEMMRCNPLPPLPNKTSFAPDLEGALLGVTGFQQFGRFVLFYATSSGPFFKGLVRMNQLGSTEFRKNGQVLNTFDDSFFLEIEPRISGTLDPFRPSPGFPQELLDLHFRLKWTGAEDLDLGEIGSKLFTEPFPELRPPRRWYELQVPAQGVPLTDELEIRILSSAGRQMGCIRGHI